MVPLVLTHSHLLLYNDDRVDARQAFLCCSGHTSRLHRQHSGISQGHTQSSYLVIFMSVLMHDAVELLGNSAIEAFRNSDLADLVYAQHTADRSQGRPLDGVHARCRRCRGKSREGNFIGASSSCCLFRCPFAGRGAQCATDTMSYLGTTLTADGRHAPELSRRLEMAKVLFASLVKI